MNTTKSTKGNTPKVSGMNAMKAVITDRLSRLRQKIKKEIEIQSLLEMEYNF